MNTRRCKAPPGPVSLTEVRSKTRPEIIHVLESVLERVKEEKVSAVYVIALDTNGEFQTVSAVPRDLFAPMVGALEVAKHSLITGTLRRPEEY